jgi:TM2 domain-containing membrane protein YozV
MTDWLPARQVPELAAFFGSAPYAAPGPTHPYSSQYSGPAYPLVPGSPYAMVPVSPKSRVAAGILNIVIPGAGRLYLGYHTIGILELLAALASPWCCYLSLAWGIVDGVIILTGGVSHDGQGLLLGD